MKVIVRIFFDLSNGESIVAENLPWYVFLHIFLFLIPMRSETDVVMSALFDKFWPKEFDKFVCCVECLIFNSCD